MNIQYHSYDRQIPFEGQRQNSNSTNKMWVVDSLSVFWFIIFHKSILC